MRPRCPDVNGGERFTHGAIITLITKYRIIPAMVRGCQGFNSTAAFQSDSACELGLELGGTRTGTVSRSSGAQGNTDAFLSTPRARPMRPQ